jgi:hypothetical protein
MSDNCSPFVLINKTTIASDLLEALIERGLGTLPALEVAIIVIEQLLHHHPEWKIA